MKSPFQTSTRKRFVAGAASVAIASAIGFGAVTSGTAPVMAEAVRIESQQSTGFGDVVERVSPAVVSVRVKAKMQPAAAGPESFFGGQGLEDLPDDHPLKRFFRDLPGFENGQPQTRPGHPNRPERARPVSQGSGFFISEDGYLVTNNHVVEGGSEFTVVMDDGTEIDAKLVGTDPRTDLALMKVDEEREFVYVDFADDTKVRVGDWVVAVGNPFGLGGTVTAGIVSARGRDIGAGPYDDFIQIDAAVNRGNSGGPAFNLNGEVVGINTAIFSPSGGNVGIAFAIPASVAKDVISELKEDGNVERAWLGVQIQPVTDDIAESLGIEGTDGAMVSEPQDDSPAMKAGIEAGDIIVEVDGKKVESPRELARMIGRMKPGTTAEVKVLRDGEEETIEVKLGEMPGMEQQASADQPEEDQGSILEDFGLTVTPAEEGEGVVVTDVQANSDAADRGIQTGDVIVSVNSQAVKNASGVEKAVNEASKAGRKAVLFQLKRDETSRFVALPVARG